MKYIRTESEIYSLDDLYVCEELNGKPYATKNGGWCIYKDSIIKEAETIEELLDEVVVFDLDKPRVCDIPNVNLHHLYEVHKNGIERGETVIFGAIWNKNGLRFVARVRNDGELVLL